MNLKKKIALLAAIFLAFISGFALLARWGMNQMHLAAEKTKIAAQIERSCQEIRVCFEQSLMGPHDYLIHGVEEERKIFESDFKELSRKILRLKQLLNETKSGAEPEMTGVLEKADATLSSVEEKLPKFERAALNILNLDHPVGNPKAGPYMEDMDLSVRKLANDLKNEAEILHDFAEHALEHLSETHQKVPVLLLAVGIIALFAVIILSYRLVRSITGPLDDLVQVSKKISGGDLKARVTVAADDEIGYLACSFNFMIDKLLMSQEQTKVIFHGAGDAMRVIDKDFSVLQTNTAMEKLTGLPARESVGKKCYDVFFGEHCHTDECCLRRILAGQEHIQAETIKETPDGKKIPVELISTPLKSKGRVTGVIESFRDITKRKQAEEKLQDSEGRLASTLESIGDAVITTNTEGKLVLMNRVAEELTGWKHTEAEGLPIQKIFKIINEKTHKPVENPIEKVLRGGRIVALANDTVLIAKDGGEYPIADSGAPIVSAGTTIGVVLVFRDVTEKRKAEKALKKALETTETIRAELDRIFKIAGDGMYVIDSTFNVLRVNNTFEHLFNAPSSEVVGKKCYEIWEDSRCHTPECTLTRILAGEERVEGEMVKKRADGTSVPCIAVGTPMKGADGEIKAIVTTYKDLTKLKTVQDQLLQSEKMAAIGQLAAGVAHEINNPVGFISSNMRTLNEYRKDLTALLRTYMEIEQLAPTLLSAKGNEELKKQLNSARALKEKMDIEFVLDDFKKVISESREGTDRVKEIVADLKDFSHVDQPELTYADINKGIESTLNIVWNELKYKAKVTKDFGELPQIACYPQQLNQVFMNILVNAAQAIEKQGEIAISTSALDGKVEIRISDTGKGIPDDVLPRVFDPFFTTKAVGEGTGLGLNMAYNIVKKHKGDIRVESTVGKGATFIIDIPVGERTEDRGQRTENRGQKTDKHLTSIF